MAQARLMGQWASVVGAEIAARCQPVSLVDGELKVAAESTAWATQLRLMAARSWPGSPGSCRPGWSGN